MGDQKYLDAATGIFETLYRNTDDAWAFTVGVHALEIDLRDLPGGDYFCRMEAGGFAQTRRMVLF